MSTQLVTLLLCMQAIYVPADDLTDPAPATTFAHLDATTVLSRGIAELGIYPAVDPLDSTSRMLDARIIGQEHYDIARQVQETLQVGRLSSLLLSLLFWGSEMLELGTRSDQESSLKCLCCMLTTTALDFMCDSFQNCSCFLRQ